MVGKSRWLLGSSSSNRSGSPINARASRRRVCCPPLSVADVKAMSCGVKPIPASSVSAFQRRLSRSVVAVAPVRRPAWSGDKWLLADVAQRVPSDSVRPARRFRQQESLCRPAPSAAYFCRSRYRPAGQCGRLFSVKERESKSVPNAVSTRKDCAVSKVLIVAYPRVTGMFMPRQTSLTITQ